MDHRAKVIVAPTLARMAGIYALSRKGGPGSPRFAAYVSVVEQNWGLAAYNPMAGDKTSAAVEALLALDAEQLAMTAAEWVLERCEWSDPVTLAVAVATPGMWTDRLATEVRHRTVGDRRAAHGEILLWASDSHRAETISRESIAEAVRTMWTSMHGAAHSLHAILAREGLACTLARMMARDDDHANAHASHARVAEAIEVLGDTTTLGDIVAVLYGDEAAVGLGYTPLGISSGAGYAFAISRATSLVERIGPAEALRSHADALVKARD